MMHQRLSSPYLADSDFSDYLVGQFTDMQSVCTTTMALTTRTIVTYAPATAFPNFPTTTTTSVPANATCTGQLISPKSPPLLCDQLSTTYGVTTGDLIAVTQDWSCGFTSPICVPRNCSLSWVPYFGQTCDALRAAYSTGSNINITAAQFSTWNPNIIGLCSSLKGSQYVCRAAPGGNYVAPSASIAAPTATSAHYSTASPSQPTSTGTVASCGAYYNVVSGDDCSSVCLKNSITFLQFQALNTQVSLFRRDESRTKSGR